MAHYNKGPPIDYQNPQIIFSPDATCIDVENPQIAVPMKSPSKRQPAQMANRRVPTTHLKVNSFMIFHVLSMIMPAESYYPRLVARIRMAGDSQRERAMPKKQFCPI